MESAFNYCGYSLFLLPSFNFSSSGQHSESVQDFCISPFFHQQSDINVRKVNTTKLNWKNRSRGRSHLSRCAPCMISAKWLKVLSSLRIMVTLKYAVTFTDFKMKTWWTENVIYKNQVCWSTYKVANLVSASVVMYIFFLSLSVFFPSAFLYHP